MTDILVTGGSGQVGRELRAAVLPAGWSVQAPGHAELDLADPVALAEAVAARPWSAVINAAAYTAVDRAESDSTAAWAVNAGAPAALATAAARAGIPLIQVSTDYVFAGDKPTPYREADPVGPLGVYGASKLGGEIAVAALNPRHAILRTSWVVSSHGTNFIKTMLRLGAEREALRVVADQRGAPTAARDIAATLIALAERMIADPAGPSGVYHFANAGETTWCELARFVFSEAARAGRREPAVHAIATADYPTPARRPANSRLAVERLPRELGLTPRAWRRAVAEIVAELMAAEAEDSIR